MKRNCLGIFVAGTLLALLTTTLRMCEAAVGAQSSPQAGAESAGPALASGTVLLVELGSTIDSKKARVGDAVNARTTEAVKVDGRVVIPKGSKLVGHVVQASARAKGDADSTVSIRFEKAVVKDSPEIPLSVWIRAIAAQPHMASAPPSQANDSIYGSGNSAAAAGSPMRTSPPPVNGVNDSPVNQPGAPDPASLAGRSSGNAGGLNEAGQLLPNSRGVFGLEGLQITAAASSAKEGTLIASTGKNVHLDSGTRILLVAQAD